MRTPARITPYPTGRPFWAGAVPGTSCQATIAPSLRDISQQALASPRSSSFSFFERRLQSAFPPFIEVENEDDDEDEHDALYGATLPQVEFVHQAVVPQFSDGSRGNDLTMLQQVAS